MRKKIAAANWKMNLLVEQGQQLMSTILQKDISLKPHQFAIFAVPFPYLAMASEKISGKINYSVAAQNCFHKSAGAYTGEVSAEMLGSLNIPYVIVGHSERREYSAESNAILAEKVNLALSNGIQPIFCCGEPLTVREENSQNEYVEKQLREGLFHLDGTLVKKIIIAYEPIWAIGTGKTATAAQAQEMHKYLRTVMAARYGGEIADNLSVLYGGSVKGSNAVEIFSQPDVDGGLVGGASLNAEEFCQIISALP